jgi:hypothetical protein
MLKVNRLDAHDRLLSFKKKAFDIGECCQNMIDQRPFGDRPFYIFAHARTDDDGVNKRLIWQPRLTKPKAQTNSMLFKAYPGTDHIKVIWMIPERSMWNEFKQGKMFEDQIVADSIFKFENDRASLEHREADDLSDKEIDAIYRQIGASARQAASRNQPVLEPQSAQ